MSFFAGFAGFAGVAGLPLATLVVGWLAMVRSSKRTDERGAFERNVCVSVCGADNQEQQYAEMNADDDDFDWDML